MRSRTSTFSQASADSKLPPSAKDSERSALPKSTKTRARSSASAGQESATWATSAEEMLLPGLDTSPSSREDLPASRGVKPGSEEARRMTATSGRQCATLLRSSGPLGSLVKMCLGSSIWASSLSVPIWKSSVTPRNRLLFQLALPEPGTGETGYGFLPTLMAQDAEQAKKFARGNPMLTEEIRGFVPTLLAADAKGGRYKKPNGGPSLRTFAADLGDGPLNPRWCEWFMGYPAGHTELKDSATRLSHKSRSPSSIGSKRSNKGLVKPGNYLVAPGTPT